MVDRAAVRRRAIRAAQVVTFGVALALPGCADSHENMEPADADVVVDAGVDASEPVDAGFDAACRPGEDSLDCCLRVRGSCAIPGPFVPPSLPAC